nr:hypothetical protein [Tanacetum cinerariifolium]
MWKPTGRHFTLYASSPLTRILEPIDEPVELTASVSSNANLTLESSPSSLAVIQQLRQFCDGGLEVTFRQHSCHIRNMDKVDLLQ